MANESAITTNTSSDHLQKRYCPECGELQLVKSFYEPQLCNNPDCRKIIPALPKPGFVKEIDS